MFFQVIENLVCEINLLRDILSHHIDQGVYEMKTGKKWCRWLAGA